MAGIFASRVPHIYLVYGLAFFVLGLALTLELGRVLDSRFKRALRPLAVFGLVHGSHEWFEMFELIGRQTYGFVPPTWMEWIRVVVLAFSFLCLGAFGLGMLRPSRQLFGRNVWFLLTMVAVYLMGVLEIGAWTTWDVPEWLGASDAWTRYTLGIPGALLAGWGLLIQRRIFFEEGLSGYGNSLIWAALAFALYGVVGQFVVSPSALFPSTKINVHWFLVTVGFPIQLFRATMASMIAIFTIRSLRAFDMNRRQQLVAAQEQVQEAVARRDALRGELLRHSVTAQEEERSRIARELHDEIGQTLTGLAAGLRGVQQWLLSDSDRARLQLRQLEGMTVKAIGELSNLVADLRPSLLDDMGLQAALGWYTEQVGQRSGMQVKLWIGDSQRRMPPEIATTLFRITQEALTNVTRHASAEHAAVELSFESGLVRLQISDDGVGFDPNAILDGELQSGWGLVGIRERVQLTGGDCHIESAPRKGTTLTVEIPLPALKEKGDGSHQTDVGR